ncbi:MAG: hypothetical protein L6R42_004601 [Xanthoria sp. 1 TBL-2021]|nr:MAG: hypothetical protein L6R42_004601 [Xanthoria sp. 1 TBL-2021]
MSRHISRSLLRHSSIQTHLYRAPQTRRFLSNAPPAQRSRSWKSSAVRWGLAAGAVYYYNTSPYFADEPMLLEPLTPTSPTDDSSLPTLDSVAKSRNRTATSESSAPSSKPLPPLTDEPTPSPLSDPSATESEAASEGAFNEETGEINWDCPCLGGMAHGPCGDQFRTAFSCFVFSKEDPKGMDCIEHFKGMQDCFKEYPEIYGGELEDDEVEKEIQGQEEEKEGLEMPVHQSQTDAYPAASAVDATTATPTGQSPEQAPPQAREQSDQSEEAKRKRAKEATAQVQKEHPPLDESDQLVPKAAHDATTANEGK